MSRQAYLEIYGQEPPAGARFGADVSWFQATADGESLDSGTLHNTWAGLAGWAEYVCIRCSYGGSGDDGAEQAHVQYADLHHYTGTLGGYHYFGPGRSGADNANNYLARSAPLAGRFTFDMLDVEEGTTAPAIEETLDRIEQKKQRTCLLYSGKSIMDNAGFLTRKRPLWVAHYASSRYLAWHPTSNWSLYQAPYMPNQYGTDYPTCWQFTSYTANHGHLDLNVTTTPAAFGIGGGAPATLKGLLDFMASNEEAWALLGRLENQANATRTRIDIVGDQLNALQALVGGSSPLADVQTLMNRQADAIRTRVDVTGDQMAADKGKLDHIQDTLDAQDAAPDTGGGSEALEAKLKAALKAALDALN